MNNKIKWACIQPLTGGIYLGTEEAIGHKAEFILSFAGLNDAEIKEYKLNSCGNELYLQRYLEKVERVVPRYDIEEGMFDPSLLENLNPTITIDGNECPPDYSDLDLVVAVPVCSGLSMATRASQDTKDIRNCNMKFITEYTLKVIKPKIYVFENAPTLMGTRGKGLVEDFKTLAENTGYSVLFYKTDTNLHHNCQKRVRTFIIFVRHKGEEIENPPVFDYENNKISIKDYFAKIDNTLNGESLPTSPHNWIVLDYIKTLFGNEWREHVQGSLMNWCIKNDKLENLKAFAKLKYEKNSEKLIKYIEHIQYKLSLGKNYFQDDIFLPTEYFPAVQFRSMFNMLHPIEDRICTVRENLALMGHPDDFEWLTGANKGSLPKIGQNVPVKTAKFIVEQCVKVLKNWDKEREHAKNASFQDNINQKEVW
jgi:site-specific DNA-cytosine methylase